MTSIMQSSSTSSTSSSTSSANLLRISGMASGIDTDSVVKSMVSNYQSKIDKANQDKQTLQWKQDAYRDIIKGMKALQDYFNPTSSKYILGGSAMNINTASSDNPAVATGIASSSAQPGTYAVTVNQLAQQAKIQGGNNDSMILAKAADWTNQKLTFDDNGTKVTLPPASVGGTLTKTTVPDLVAEINSDITASSLNGKITASYVNVGGKDYIKFTQNSSNTDAIKILSTDNASITDITQDTTINKGISAASKLSDLNITSNLSFDLSYDSTTTATPVNITAASTDTLQSLMDKVKSASNGAVTMSIDDTTGSISFQSKNYGSTTGITIKNASANISQLGITDVNATTATGVSKTGLDANVTISAPGQAAVTTTQSSNQFTLNGVNYSLVKGGGATANITVTANTDNVVKNVQNFITDYNTVITAINTKLTEKKDPAYPPLTDAQRQSMSESQITAWEAKAKVGILRNDDYLSDLMTQLRGIFSSPVYSSYGADPTQGKVPLALGQYGSNAIGIDTSSDSTDGGKLVIVDQNKLADTIANRFDDFKKLFTGASSTTADSTKPYIGSKTYMEDGIFTRMNTIMRSYVADPGLGTDGTYSLSGSMNIFVNKQYDFSASGTASKNTLPDQVYEQSISIKNLQTQMTDAENRYYAKFTALETAMTKLNSQQSQLSAMLGQG